MLPEKHRLKNGEHLHVHTLDPPLPESYRSLIWWRFVQDELLKGAWSDTLYTVYFVGRINEEIAGSLAYYAPADTRDIGVVEFVSTEDEHRRKGMASVLMDCMIDHFTQHGGQVLYLCTNNPSAGALYEKHGFWYHVGDGMRYLAPDAEDFDRRYFAGGEPARVRAATWGDLPRMAALYNHPEPDWLIKNYLTQSFNDTRVEVHFLQLMKRIEGGNGLFYVLETADRRAVGAVAIERLSTYYEQHVAHITFRIAPAYLSQAEDLISAVETEARKIGIEILHIQIAGRDIDQIELIKSLSFEETARFKRHFKDGDSPYDLLVFGKELCGGGGAKRGKKDYYGGREPWQADRISDNQSEK